MINYIVALRKESVDRNRVCGCSWLFGLLVALRKESVDRNNVIRPAIDVFLASLSARRAWIEIVDPDKDSLTDDGRSPQGERG